jgi:hypothetical protein
MKKLTVSELIEWLKSQDQGAIVEIVAHRDGRSYYDQGGNAGSEFFDPDKHVEYTDYRDNKWVAQLGCSGERRLLLGSMNG